MSETNLPLGSAIIAKRGMELADSVRRGEHDDAAKQEERDKVAKRIAATHNDIQLFVDHAVMPLTSSEVAAKTVGDIVSDRIDRGDSYRR